MRIVLHNALEAKNALLDSRRDLIKAIWIALAVSLAVRFIPSSHAGFAILERIVDWLALILIAVQVHRGILLQRTDRVGAPPIKSLIRYALWFIFANLVLLIPGVIFAVLNALLPFARSPVWLATLLGLISGLYLSARVSLILPNRAVGQTEPLGNVWQWSSGNGWKLVGALYIPLLVLSIPTGLLALLFHVPPPHPEGIIVNVLFFLASLPVIISAPALLSVAYRDLHEHSRENAP